MNPSEAARALRALRKPGADARAVKAMAKARRKIPLADFPRVRERVLAGETFASIAREYNCHPRTVKRAAERVE